MTVAPLRRINKERLGSYPAKSTTCLGDSRRALSQPPETASTYVAGTGGSSLCCVIARQIADTRQALASLSDLDMRFDRAQQFALAEWLGQVLIRANDTTLSFIE